MNETAIEGAQGGAGREAVAPEGADAPQATTPAEGGTPGQPPETPASVLGQVAWLMMSSPLHKHLFLADLEWLVAPAVTLRQFHIFRNERTPFAYASWAFVSEEVAARLEGGERRLRPGDWRSGDLLWLVDVVAPFGAAEKVVEHLRRNRFPDRALHAQMPKEGGGTKVMRWPPAGEGEDAKAAGGEP